MSADSLQAFDPCPDFDGLAEKLDLLLALQDPASQRASRLVANEQDRAFLPPQVMLQMVADPPGLTHAGSRYDHLRPLDKVDLLGILAARRNLQPREHQRVDPGIDQL